MMSLWDKKSPHVSHLYPDHVWTNGVKPFGIAGGFGHDNVGFIEPGARGVWGEDKREGQKDYERKKFFHAGGLRMRSPWWSLHSISLTITQGQQKDNPE
jgi:hypothetical protein